MMRNFISHHRESLSGLINLGGSRLILTGLSFVSSILIARNLGAEQLGVFALMTGAFAYVSIFSEFGLRSTVTAEASRRDSTGAVFGIYLRLRLMICVATYIAVMAVTWLLYKPFVQPTALIMLSIFFFALQIDWILLINRQYHAAGWIALTRWVAYLGMIAIVTHFWQLDLKLLAQIFLYSWVIAAFFSWVAVFRSGGSLRPREGETAPEARPLIKSGAAVLGATLISQALQNADLLWVGKAFGASDAGHYYLASSIVGAGLIFANAIGQMATAQYALLRNDPTAIATKLKTDLRLMLLTSITISIAFYIAAPATQFLFGQQYEAVAELIRHFIPYAILYHAWSLYFCILIALGLEKNLLISNIITIALMPPLLLFATSTENLQHIAFAKAGLLAGGILLMHWKVSKYIQKKSLNFFIPTTITAVFSAAIIVAIDNLK